MIRTTRTGLGRRSQAERNAATRAALIGAARAIFTEIGFADAATEVIVARAGVTRGALYHHFPDKAALFAAVAEVCAAEVLDAIERRAARAQDARGALVLGCRAFLDAILADDVRRILLIDAPAVLGWAAWRALDARYAMGSLREGVEALARAERLAIDVAAATHLLSGALNEAALYLAEGAPRRRRAVNQTVDHLIAGLCASR